MCVYVYVAESTILFYDCAYLFLLMCRLMPTDKLSKHNP